MVEVYQVLAQRLGVSRETHARYEALVALLEKWQKAKNLVASSTLSEVWQRHVADSLQLALHMDLAARRVADLGAGAGFPGLVLAIYAQQTAPETQFTLVEANHKKCAFLREAGRQLALTNLEILNSRIENIPEGAFKADMVTARALATVDTLLEWGAPLLKPEGKFLLLKGRGVDEELAAASRNWRYGVQKHSSLTDGEAAIVEISAPRRISSETVAGE